LCLGEVQRAQERCIGRLKQLGPLCGPVAAQGRLQWAGVAGSPAEPGRHHQSM